MSLILDIITNGDVWIVTLDVNPVTSGGVDAPIGSYGTAIDGSGLFLKYGSLVTDWEKSNSISLLITDDIELDFGFQSSDEGDIAKVNIPNLLVTNANIKSFSFISKANSEHDLDDFTAENVNFKIENIQDNVSFDIVGTAQPNNTWGKYLIKYMVTI